MKKDEIDKLFEKLKYDFDLHDAPEGHGKRFFEKLEDQSKSSIKYPNWRKYVSIAASVAIIIALGFNFTKSNSPKVGLANVSPEMEQTQSFFTAAVNKQMNTLKGFDSPETKNLVNDALKQINTLEKEYDGLRRDLKISGNDKRVIYAMINNFQKRMDLLKQVIEKIEEVKKLNNNTDETTI